MILIKLLYHIFFPPLLLILNQIMICFFIVSFLLLGKFRSCYFKYFLTPFLKVRPFWLFLNIIYSFLKLQRTQTGDPIMASLMLQKFEIFFSPCPSFRAYRYSSKNNSLSSFNCGCPVCIPVGISQEPSILGRSSWKIFPRYCFYCHSTDLRYKMNLLWTGSHNLQVLSRTFFS